MTATQASEHATGQKLRGHLRRNADLLTNSSSLMASTIVTSALGFVYWWLAARTASQNAVGFASAAVSAMTVIGTIGMFGMGTMLIAELPRRGAGRWQLITSCLLVAGSVAGIIGAGYLLFVGVAVPHLGDSLGSAPIRILLLAGITVNAVTLVLDEALIGLFAGPVQLARNTYFAATKLVLLGAAALLPITLTGGELLATWVSGIVGSVLLVRPALRAHGWAGSARPKLALMRGLGRATVDHNVLNMALFLPRMALPLVVTAVLSTSANAAFYAAWMVLTVLVMIPTHLSTTLFAVSRGDLETLRVKVRMGLLVAIGIGLPLSLLLALLAHPIMQIFGAGYADAAGTALRILAFTYLPAVFRQFYVAISRGLGRVRRAGVLALFAGLAELAAAAYGGSRGNLTDVAACLAVVMVAECLITVPAVLRLAWPGGVTFRSARGR
jgi:O-antigen/teichoic acid export membrane protein